MSTPAERYRESGDLLDDAWEWFVAERPADFDEEVIARYTGTPTHLEQEQEY